METPFLSLRETLEARMRELPEPPCRSERAELFKELYGFYERSYKKNTWSDYLAWLRRNRFRHSSERVVQYEKDKSYRKIIPVSSFCSYWFGFLKTSDLYYLISVVRDMEHRGMNVNRWLFWAIKPKADESVV